SSANPPVGTAATPTPTGAMPTIDPCLTVAADNTKSLEDGKASATIRAPNLTQLNPPPRACGPYVADFQVMPSSKAPNGYTNRFAARAPAAPLGTAGKKTCAAARPDVRIFKKGQAAFLYAGGGKLTTVWPGDTQPQYCEFKEAAGYKVVSGNLPAV